MSTMMKNQENQENHNIPKWNMIDYLNSQIEDISVEEKKALDEWTKAENDIEYIKKVEKEIIIHLEGITLLRIFSEISSTLNTIRKNTTPDDGLHDFLDMIDKRFDAMGQIIMFTLTIFPGFHLIGDMDEERLQNIADTMKSNSSLIKLSEIKLNHKRVELLREFNQLLLNEIKSRVQTSDNLYDHTFSNKNTTDIRDT